MKNRFCFCLLDLISKNTVVDIETILNEAKKGKIVDFICDLNKEWGSSVKYDCSELNERIKNYDFEVIEKCGIDSESNGLIQLLALIINYEDSLI